MTPSGALKASQHRRSFQIIALRPKLCSQQQGLTIKFCWGITSSCITSIVLGSLGHSNLKQRYILHLELAFYVVAQSSEVLFPVKGNPIKIFYACVQVCNLQSSRFPMAFSNLCVVNYSPPFLHTTLPSSLFFSNLLPHSSFHITYVSYHIAFL